jgi:small subunit ribosomal protein S27e
MKETKSRFIRIKCDDCGNEQIIYDRATTKVKCLVCDRILAEPKGGKAAIKTKIIDMLDKDI